MSKEKKRGKTGNPGEGEILFSEGGRKGGVGAKRGNPAEKKETLAVHEGGPEENSFYSWNEGWKGTKPLPGEKKKENQSKGKGK